MNIWSKALPTNAAGKPVLVLFHGGRKWFSRNAKPPLPSKALINEGFAGSNTNSPFANGQHIANAEDLLVTSVNYRLNAFGFPGAPGADTNLGLRDQRLAVEWLKDNVAAFGGDPKRMVIAGQSSGGAAVDWWSYAYKQDPIVKGLISTSGNTFSFPMNTAQKQRDNWLALATALGCGSTNDTLTCMRSGNITSQAITAAVAKIAPSPGGSPVRSTPPFYPMVDNQTIFNDYLSLSSAGDFARLPYLQGHNDYEQGYYVIPAFAQGRNVTAAQTAQFLLESFVCPISYEAKQRSKVGVPTWAYRYFGDWENTRLYPTSGAYHGTELHMILGSSEDASGIPATQVQKDTAKLFQRAVAVFVADPTDGLLNAGWPQFDPVRKSWVEIAVGNRPAITFADPAEYDGTCPLVIMGALSTVS